MQRIDLRQGLAGTAITAVGALGHDLGPDGLVLRRLPDWTRPQVPAFMEIMLTQPSGVRLLFSTDSDAIELGFLTTRLRFPGRSGKGAPFDLVVDGTVHTAESDAGDWLEINLADRGRATRVRGEPGRVRFAGLGGAMKRCELWLPQNAITALQELALEPGAQVTAAAPAVLRRWVHHGSSISHCAEALSPTRTWPAVAARLAGVDLLNLGLGGNCHLDPFVARTIRDLPADVISLKAGINVVNLDSLKERTFAPLLHGFIDTVRDGHPGTPFIIASPIFCPSAEDVPGPTVPDASGMFRTFPGHAEIRGGSLTLKAIRSIIAGVVAGRRERGDVNLHYLDGLSLFGADEVADLPDALHPNGAGYVRIGERFHRMAFVDGPFRA